MLQAELHSLWVAQKDEERRRQEAAAVARSQRLPDWYLRDQAGKHSSNAQDFATWWVYQLCAADAACDPIFRMYIRHMLHHVDSMHCVAGTAWAYAVPVQETNHQTHLVYHESCFIDRKAHMPDMARALIMLLVVTVSCVVVTCLRCTYSSPKICSKPLGAITLHKWLLPCCMVCGLRLQVQAHI